MITLPPRATQVLVLFLGIGLAYYAVKETQDYVAQLEQSRLTTIPVARVVTFRTDLPKGHVVTESDIALTEFASSSIPPEAVWTVSEALGAYLSRDVLSGEAARQVLLSREPVAKEPRRIVERRGTKEQVVELEQ